MAKPILDLSSKLVSNITYNQVLNLIYLIFLILIFVVGFYNYIKVEKETKTLLIALGFFFFFLAGLAEFKLGNNYVFDFLNKDLIYNWLIFWDFIGGLCVLIAVEPIKAFNHFRSQ